MVRAAAGGSGLERSPPGEVRLAEDFKTHVVQSHTGLLDVVDVHGHGRAIPRMHDQRIGIVDADLGLQQRRAEV